MIDGKIPLPTRPGLGVEVNRDALKYYEDAARNAYQA
jgi:L-alanine-DL-glutamate epimerase-like enolase superfamily enzyme